MNSNKFPVINLKPNKTNNKNSTVREKKWIIVLSHKNRSEWWIMQFLCDTISHKWVQEITMCLPQETELDKQDTTWWRLSSWPGQPDSHRNTSSLNESHLEKKDVNIQCQRFNTVQSIYEYHKHLMVTRGLKIMKIYNTLLTDFEEN